MGKFVLARCARRMFVGDTEYPVIGPNPTELFLFGCFFYATHWNTFRVSVRLLSFSILEAHRMLFNEKFFQTDALVFSDSKAGTVFGDNNWISSHTRVEPLGSAVRRKCTPAGGSFAREAVLVSRHMCALKVVGVWWWLRSF